MSEWSDECLKIANCNLTNEPLKAAWANLKQKAIDFYGMRDMVNDTGKND